MTAKTPSGYLACGPLTKAPEQRTVRDKPMVRFSIRTGWEDAPPGETRRKGTFIEVTCWDDLAQPCMNLQKGDFVLVVGQLSSRSYNGKTYTELRAEAVYPDIRVLLSLLCGTVQPAAPPPTDPTDLTGAELYPGERLADYAPPAQRTPPPPDPLGEAVVLSDADDLPF